jgi:16S rRNA (adenine1518-N6/adenine1519-N6)-dimethyltransferase
MKLSEMKQVLTRDGIQLSKSLGQNFLHDANQLQKIIQAAELKKTDKVLEIGPGLGPLTELLIGSAGEVLAIEKDSRLVAVLKRRFDNPVLHLVQEDALDFIKHNARDWSDWKLVANLPYSVASPILVELAQSPNGPERMVVTLQLEVAKRLMATCDEQDYGVLTLLIQLRYEPREWRKIPASCFFPEPDVDSAFVCVMRRERPLLEPGLAGTFVRIVKRGFSQRRKMMLKLLKQDWPLTGLEAAFERLGISKQARAETVRLEQFVGLTEALAAGQRPEARGQPSQDRRERTAAEVAEEIFDVVNERDEVIGRETRGEVHRLGLMHRAVHVLVFNARGDIFLQKRSLSKDRQPGLWDSSASGHVDSGEDYDACAMREVREEIGLELESTPERLFKLTASAATDQEHVWVYRCSAEGPFDLNANEIERGDWFSPGKIAEWSAERPQDFAAAFLVIWRQITT